VFKQAQALASVLVIPPLSNDHYSYQWLRDNHTHEGERARHDGSLFVDKENPTRAQFAHGVLCAEKERVRQWSYHKPRFMSELAGLIDCGSSNDESSNDDGYNSLPASLVSVAKCLD
jgi:hypothetical protein